MIYVENISALEFWLSAKRASMRFERLPRASRLSDLPTTARELAQTPLDVLPVSRSALHLLVPDEKLRVQKHKHVYRVSTGGFVPYSFVQVSKDICIASPELTLVQVSERLTLPQLARTVDELCSTYLPQRGYGGGFIDEVPSATTLGRFRAARQSTRASSILVPCNGRSPIALKSPPRPKKRSCSSCSTCRQSAVEPRFPDSR